MSNLNLIDWALVGTSALWIVGLSVVLAALSFANYAAQRSGARTRSILQQPSYQLPLTIGLTLFCAGLLGATNTWWERGLWAVLTIAFAYQVWAAWRATK